jgi:hypothetical protein
MTPADYRKLREVDVVGRTATLTRRVGTAELILPAGATVTILRKFGGFDIQGELCTKCRIQVRINRVKPDAVSLNS